MLVLNQLRFHWPKKLIWAIGTVKYVRPGCIEVNKNKLIGVTHETQAFP